MPKVVISGYYGFHNNGDEAMLYAILTALRKRVPRLQAVVLSNDPGYTAGVFNVDSIPRHNLNMIRRALRHSDLLISGGGGLLQDVTGPNSILYYLGVVQMARMLGKPVLFYGQGIGPVRTLLGKTMVKLIVNKVDVITVRDHESKVELERLGVNRPPVHVTADPALGLDENLVRPERGREILAGTGAGGSPLAGVSVRPWQDLDGYKRVLAGICDRLAERGWQVLLVPMHYPADVEVCRQVAGYMKNPGRVLEGRINFRDMLSVVANLDLAIGMRLHFLIFSAMAGVPPVGIAYDPKVDRFLRLVGLPPAHDVHTLAPEPLWEAVQKAIAGKEQTRSRLLERVKQLRGESLVSADLAAGLLLRSP